MFLYRFIFLYHFIVFYIYSKYRYKNYAFFIFIAQYFSRSEYFSLSICIKQNPQYLILKTIFLYFQKDISENLGIFFEKNPLSFRKSSAILLKSSG